MNNPNPQRQPNQPLEEVMQQLQFVYANLPQKKASELIYKKFPQIATAFEKLYEDNRIKAEALTEIADKECNHACPDMANSCEACRAREALSQVSDYPKPE